MLTEKDLISDILLTTKFCWDFVVNNKPTKRPSGDIILMVSQDLRKCISSRVFIIKSKDEFHILGQVQIDRHEDDYLIDYEKLIEYQQTCNRNGVLKSIDLNNPYYNVEWHFEIPRSFWFSLMDNLRAIMIPVLPTGLVYSGDITRTIWIKKELDYLTFKWVGEDERYDKVTNIMNDLLNHALKKINSAYWINGYL